MTYTLDRRTREEAVVELLAPREFFEGQFPELAARHGRLVAAAMESLNAPPLSITVEQSSWSVVCEGDTIQVRTGGHPDALHLPLSVAHFSEFAQNQLSLYGLMAAGAVNPQELDLAAASTWDAIWLCLLEGWPVVGPALTFTDEQGQPLKLTRIFTPADPPEEIGRFLTEAGFLHLRGWIGEQDVAAIFDEITSAAHSAVEGDGKSWWAQLTDGSRRCVRIQQFAETSPTTERLLASAAWGEIVALISGEDTLVEGQYVEALIKPVGVVAGRSDVSFHRDCHLGRHAYLCARRTVGLSITETGGGNGSLRVVAGSHRLAMPVHMANAASYLPVVAVETLPGDVTVHLSCTLHDSAPPMSSERRVLYVEVPMARSSDATGVTAEEALRQGMADG